MSRILVISSYPPRHCGIGAYARAQVERLREEGHRVTVLSPPDGSGDVRLEAFGGRPFRAAARRGAAFDRIVVHFQPALWYRPRAPLSKIATSLALSWLVLRRPQTEIVVHEADPPRWWRPDELLLAAAFRLAPSLVFHTEREQRALERAVRGRVRARIAPHTEGVRVAAGSREAARRRLGIPPRERVLVAPGFLHEGKGFDRAVRAFAGSGSGRLYVVGSVKDATPANLGYAGRLRRLVAETDRAELVERFVEDEEFDAWIRAADALILPYRRSWSSGVLARARLLGTPAIVADAGGLEEQASASDVVVRDDAELAEAVRRVLDPHEVAG